MNLPDSSSPSSSSLPVQMNTIIGRAGEIAILTHLLRRENVRLLTLTGPGGVGKTRLALDVARESQAHFRDGVYFVSLAPLRRAEQVLPAFAQALGIEQVAQHPLLERLKTYVSERQLLLLIDNFEHVLDAAPLLTELLTVAPQLHVLVTSREVLHLYGEREFEVPPLALPDPRAETLTPTSAMTLFVERAQAVKPAFELNDENMQAVAAICVQLDGLPLAIELAAARVKLLAPSAILVRLQSRLDFLTSRARDVPQRHQTLRNTLNWSYDLLNECEQRFFRGLGVFVGSWTLKAAQICGGLEDDTLELLTSLVDKSLVRVVEDETGEMRFMLLETIREYALDCLEKQGEQQEARKRHAGFYLKLAEEAEPYLYGKEQRSWLERLDREAANILAALQWVIARRELEYALRFSCALLLFLQLRGSLSEGRNWLEEILAFCDTREERLLPLYARVLYGAGALALMRNELTLARSRLEESEKLAADIGDTRTRAIALGMLAALELHLGNYENARRFAEEGSRVLAQADDRWCKGILHNIYGKIESQQSHFKAARVRFHISLMLLKEVGDLRGQADTMVNLAHILRLQGKLKSAQFLYSKSLALFQAVGGRWNQATCLNGIGDILLLRGHYAEARARFEESLTLASKVGNQFERAAALTGLGQVAICLDDLQTASRYLRESLRLTREMQHTAGVAQLLLGLGDLERSQSYDKAAQAHYEQCLTLTKQIGDRVSMAHALYGLGEVARKQDEFARACTLFKQGIQLSWEIGDFPGLAVLKHVLKNMDKYSQIWTFIPPF